MDRFAGRLLHWYDGHGRHDLPWQGGRSGTRTAYEVWVSEIMLQQTRVATVIPYFTRFVAALPDVRALAAAPEDTVMALWSGLGYYRRARYLRSAAQLCVERHGGELPRDFDALAGLPGIGRSTASAIAALAYGQRSAILDGNVKRVLARYHGIRGWPGDGSTQSALWTLAEAHAPTTRPADYTQAIMDLGATVCVRVRPSCHECPQRRGCFAHRHELTDAIPAPRPPRVLPLKRAIFVVLRDRRGRVLLQRRPPEGIWPGLWSLPQAADARAARGLASGLAELDGLAAVELPAIRHSFTHFRLLATPVEWRGVRRRRAIADDPDSRWCPPAGIAEYGIPAPLRKLLPHLLDAAAPRRANGGSPTSSRRPRPASSSARSPARS